LTTYQYILEIGKKDTMSIKALVIGDDPKESFVSHERITIKDELVGINNSNGIEVITRNNKNNTLGIFHIRGLRIMDHVEYALPPRFAFINSKDIRLVGRNAIGWVESANTRAKIYLEPDQLIFTLDHQSATDILFLGAKSKKERVLIVPEKTDPNCNSFLIDSTLLRLSVFDNYFTIKSYSLRDGSLKSKVTYSLDQASADTKKLEGIIKNDATVKEKFKELTRSTKYGAVPFIIGNGNDTRTYFVTVGSYRFDNRIRYSGIGTPIIELFNYGYGALANQLDDAPLNKPTINNYLGGVYAVDKVDFTLKANPFFQKVNELLKSKEFLFISASEPHDSKIYLLAKRLKTNELVVFEIRE